MRRSVLFLTLFLFCLGAVQAQVRVVTTSTDPDGTACTLTTPPTILLYQSGSTFTTYICTSSTWSAVAAGSGTIGGTASTTDNAIVRTTGTGGVTVQGYTSNDPTISDAGAANFPGGITGALTGNADTATALAANGSNCSAGSAPLGVDASGAVESCTDYEEDLANSAGLAAALSDETGTGAAVFGTAPTITGAKFKGPIYDVVAYGAIVDDATSDVTAINAAITAARTAGGGMVFFPPGEYTLDESIVVEADDVVLSGYGATLNITAAPSNGVFDLENSSNSPSFTALDADIAEGDSTVVLPSGGGTAFSAGDYVLLRATTVAYGSSDRTREMRRVQSVSTDTLTLDTPVLFPYATADTAEYARLVMDYDNVTIEGFKITNSGNYNARTLEAQFVHNVTVRDVSVIDSPVSLSFSDCHNVTVDNFKSRNGYLGSTTAFEYAIIAVGATYSMTVNNAHIENARHAFTTIGYQDANTWGGPEFITISNSVGIGDPNNADVLAIWDTHNGGSHITFDNVTAIGSVINGFQVRGKHVTISDCKVSQTGGGNAAIRIDPLAAYVTVTGCTITDPVEFDETTCVGSGDPVPCCSGAGAGDCNVSGILVGSDHGLIANNYIDGMTENGITLAPEANNITVTGNTILNVPAAEYPIHSQVNGSGSGNVVTNNFIPKGSNIYSVLAGTDNDIVISGNVTTGGYTQNTFGVNHADSAVIGLNTIDEGSFTNKAIVFEGATKDNFETTLTPTDPTADRTITLPDKTGTAVLDTYGVTWKPDGTNVSSVRAWDYDADGTFEMTDLQSILTAYGADTELVIPAGSWVAQDNESNSNGVIEITNDNVHIRCEGGAVLNGPKQYFGTHDGAANHPNLDDSTAAFGTLTGYTLDNLTDGSSCTVTSNTGTTATCTLTGGTDNDWDASDAYSLELDIMAAVYVTGNEFSIDGCEIDGGLPDATATTVDLDGVSIQKHGVRLLGTDRFWITNNYMHDLNHAGVITDAASNGVIAGNYILRTGRYGSTPAVDTSENGIQLYTENGDSDTRNIVVANNIIDKFTGNGIALRKAAETDTVQDIAIDGNIISNQENSGGSCVNPFGGDGVIISNTQARNCRLHVTGDADFISNGTADSVNSVRDVLIENFNLDNSAWTVTSADVKIGEFNEGLTIRNLTVYSAATSYCLDLDPPWIGLEISNATWYNCQDEAFYITNVSASNHAIGASGVAGSLTEDPDYDLVLRNWRVIDPAGTGWRVMGDVPILGWTFDGLEVAGLNGTNEDWIRRPNDASLDYEWSDFRFRNWTIQGNTTGHVIDLEDAGSPTVEDWELINVDADGIGGYVVNLASIASTPDDITARDGECRGSGCDGYIADAGATNLFLKDIRCPDATNDCRPAGIGMSSADQALTSTVTLTDATGLKFYARPNRTYRVTGKLFYTTFATPDFRWSISCPSSPTNVHFQQQRKAHASNSDLLQTTTWDTCGFSAVILASSDGDGYVDFAGTYTNGSTAGDVSVQFTQSTSDAGATTLERGSWIEWEMVP